VTTVRSIESDAELGYRQGSGWIAFAAPMLAIGGTFKIFDAIWALMYQRVRRHRRPVSPMVRHRRRRRRHRLPGLVYYQPLWTMLSVTLMVLTIYALAAHGGHRDPWA
jgi:hypothetical protein